MKNFFFWLGGLITGALAGYLSAIFFGFNTILAVCCGIVLGSTTAITLNILRDEDEEERLTSSDSEPSTILETGDS